jgi:hypothetical protein
LLAFVTPHGPCARAGCVVTTSMHVCKTLQARRVCRPNPLACYRPLNSSPEPHLSLRTALAAYKNGLGGIWGGTGIGDLLFCGAAPAIVALGFSLYEQRMLLRRNLVPIVGGSTITGPPPPPGAFPCPRGGHERRTSRLPRSFLLPLPVKPHILPAPLRVPDAPVSLVAHA